MLSTLRGPPVGDRRQRRPDPCPGGPWSPGKPQASQGWETRGPCPPGILQSVGKVSTCPRKGAGTTSRQWGPCSTDDKHMLGMRGWLPDLVLLTLEGAERRLANWLKGRNAAIQPDVLSPTPAETHAADSGMVGSASFQFLPRLWLGSMGAGAEGGPASSLQRWAQPAWACLGHPQTRSPSPVPPESPEDLSLESTDVPPGLRPEPWPPDHKALDSDRLWLGPIGTSEVPGPSRAEGVQKAEAPKGCLLSSWREAKPSTAMGLPGVASLQSRATMGPDQGTRLSS